MPKRTRSILCGLLLAATPALAQTPDSTATGALRVFIDCQTRCDMEYLRTELDFVEHMRDRQDADVHVLVTAQGTGAGGNEYTISFTGLQEYEGVTEELRFATPPNQAEDRTRQQMERRLAAGFLRYLARGGSIDAYELALEAPEGVVTDGSGTSGQDPWNHWVFRVGLNGFANAESSYSNYNWNAQFSANRVTEGWRTNVNMNLRRSSSSTDVGDRTITSLQEDQAVNSLIVRSLNDRWSAGWRTNLNQSTFLNQDLSVRGGPALEFNVFPYSESTRREMRIQYSVGVNQVDYRQETIFGRFSETLLDERLSVTTEMRQRWGNVRVQVEGSHYLHDFAKNQLGVNGNIELRLFRGIGLNFNGDFSRIRDQLHLARGNLTPEQILVRQQQIATSFRYFLNFGLSYSFGSIYNTVVNPRMGN